MSDRITSNVSTVGTAIVTDFMPFMESETAADRSSLLQQSINPSTDTEIEMNRAPLQVTCWSTSPPTDQSGAVKIVDAGSDTIVSVQSCSTTAIELNSPVEVCIVLVAHQQVEKEHEMVRAERRALQ